MGGYPIKAPEAAAAAASGEQPRPQREDTEDRATALKECRHGRMLFLKHDRYIGRSLDVYGEFSELEAAIFPQLVAAGHVVIEAGANIGAHTLHLARLVGRSGQVLAFEPQPVIHQLLCANVALNELFHVRTFNAAVGRAAGRIQVPSIDYRNANNFGGVSLDGSNTGESVPMLCVDDLPLTALRMLKVDVEGMEIDVLSGARRTIDEFRPVLYVENDRRDHSEALITLIAELGYEMWWHLPTLYNPDNFAGHSRNIFGRTVSVNLLCLAKEARSDISGLRKVMGPTDWWQTRAR